MMDSRFHQPTLGSGLVERTPKKVGFQLQRPFSQSKTGLDTKSGVDLEPRMRGESACTSFKKIVLTFFFARAF